MYKNLYFLGPFMMHKAVFLTFISTSLLYGDCSATPPYPMKVTLRNIEAAGIGYNQGYTSLDLFLSPYNQLDSWTPFVDIRGHIFHNKNLALNLGLGLRYTSYYVYGINAYYDYRTTKHNRYNQLSIGIEALGEYVDFRLNGYLPFRNKTSSPFQSIFDKFSQNFMIISYKREEPLKGFNGEVGFHIDTLEHIPFYITAGPYYLTTDQNTTCGGEGRITIDFYQYLRLEANLSYDRLFKWIAQGEVSLTVPFGGRCPLKKRLNQCCSTTLALKKRSIQRIDRKEIIPVTTKKEAVIAYNPLTGNPYHFIFVDNTSSSLGTFESPVPSFREAENLSIPSTILYIFPGDGTSRGMSEGITLKENQMILGSSLSYPFTTQAGSVTIPPFSSTMPCINNPSGPAITAASNTTISGLCITESLPGVFATEIENLTISENQFTSSTLQDGITIGNIRGLLSVTNNSFVSTSAYFSGPSTYSNGVIVNNQTGSARLSFVNNFFNNHGGYGIGVNIENNATGDIYVSGNTILGPIGFEDPITTSSPNLISPSAIGILVAGRDNSTSTSSIVNNTCKYHEAAGIFVTALNKASSSSVIEGNLAIPGALVSIAGGSIPGLGIGAESFGNAVLDTVIRENVVSGGKTAGIGVAHFSLANGTTKIISNHVREAGTNPGGTFFGAGIIVANEALFNDAGRFRAVVMDNILFDNGAYGGALCLSLAIPQGVVSVDSTCLRFVNNISNTKYSIYNASTDSAKIYLEEGYQTNIGPIDFLPPPPTTGFPPSGPVDIIPINGCGD